MTNSVATLATETMEIQGLMENWQSAVKAGDLDQIMLTYSEDVVAFDAIGALQFVGRPAYREHWQRCLELCTGFESEVHQLHIEADGNLAFCRFLMQCSGTNENGEKESGWVRVTNCLKNTTDGWKIVHEHFSMPMDMETGKVLENATP